MITEERLMLWVAFFVTVQTGVSLVFGEGVFVAIGALFMAASGALGFYLVATFGRARP